MSARNFVIICVDCLRCDCVALEASLTSSLAPTLQNADVFFEHAYSAAPWTYPATNSILTGRYPRNHGAWHHTPYRERVSEPWPDPMAPAVPTLFSLLGPIGCYTLGVSTIYWALNQRCPYNEIDKIVRTEDQNVFYKNTKAEWVFGRFLEAYDEEIRGAPFCAYLHLIDLHRPYDLELAQQHSVGPLEIVEGLDEWDIQRLKDVDPYGVQVAANPVLVKGIFVWYEDPEAPDGVSYLSTHGTGGSIEWYP